MTRDTGRIFDELLLISARAGDRRAGERLAARWQPRLLRTARRLLRDEDEAVEAVQNAWAAICRGWFTLQDPARFPAWAFTILHRKCADRIRGNQSDRARYSELTPDAGAVARGAPEDGLAIRQAMDGLSVDHRAAAVLFFGEGMTLIEVAEITGVPVGTAKSRIFHARRQMKAALEGEEE
ncbi:RNA polymerase sigma factor [Henriciella algicola]|uniref:RNA polymerase sigma factor n=1 Tax=Henriciella algicola TaxID=1608422 RepID=A0A399RJF6_9PROT|nr:RNA polymerase sigma factor [Henriciella algicola]RIJ31776.1 RNA polymerase sigma factor [Henriciella algicola]